MFNFFESNTLSKRLWALTVLEQVEVFVERGNDRKRAIHLTAVLYLTAEAVDSFAHALSYLHRDIGLHPFALQNVEAELDRALHYAKQHL